MHVSILMIVYAVGRDIKRDWDRKVHLYAVGKDTMWYFRREPRYWGPKPLGKSGFPT
jgi:hypothetical protein